MMILISKVVLLMVMMMMISMGTSMVTMDHGPKMAAAAPVLVALVASVASFCTCFETDWTDFNCHLKTLFATCL